MRHELPLLAKVAMYLLLVSLVSPAPVSETTNITLNVEPIALEIHKIAISIESSHVAGEESRPISSEFFEEVQKPQREDKGIDIKSNNSNKISVGNSVKAITGQQEMAEFPFSASRVMTSDSTGLTIGTSTNGEFEDNASSMDARPIINNRTITLSDSRKEVDKFKNNNSSTESITNNTTAQLTRLAVKTATRPVGTDIQGFLITVPNNQCPPGYKLDANGKCREVYGNHSYKWDRSNFLGGQGKRNSKYLRKMIRY